MVRIKGKDIPFKKITGSHDRRALQCRNTIYTELHRLGVPEDDIELKTQNFCFRKAPASVTWYMGHDLLYYSYALADNYAENLQIVMKVIAVFVEEVIGERLSLRDFMKEFVEDGDIEEHRRMARETLGLEHHETDFATIDKRYKELARKHHPDMGGDPEKFKTINRAHKILRRELQ